MLLYDGTSRVFYGAGPSYFLQHTLFHGFAQAQAGVFEIKYPCFP